MAITTYDKGDRLTLTTTWTTTAGVATDPTATVLTVHRPDGTVPTTTPLTHGATGVYSFDLDLDQVGFWEYRWVATGALVAAEEGAFYVRATHF